MKLNIGENIKRLRVQKNTTQEELAGYLGVSYQAVSRWENNQCYPDIELLPDIARFFEIKMDELLGTGTSPEEIDSIVCEMSSVQFTDSRKALDTLHALEKEHPNNWQIKEGICKALLEDGEGDYDRVMPEMRRYGWEARMKFDREDVWNTQMLYRAIILAAPEEEVLEWADQQVSHLYNTQTANMLLRYTDFRRDAEKARYWQGRAILEYTQALADQLRNPFFTGAKDYPREGWLNACETALRLFDAVCGIPYKKDGVVYNTLFLVRRIYDAIEIVLHASQCGRKERALSALEKAADYLLLYADALKQDRHVSDLPYFDFDDNAVIPDGQYDYMVHDREYDLFEYAMNMEDAPGWQDTLSCIRDTEEFKTQLARIRAAKQKTVQE